VHSQQVFQRYQALWCSQHTGGREAIERNPDRLERWACVNLMKFNQAKCMVRHLGWGNPKHKYRLGRQWIEGSSEEKDLDVLLDEKLNVTQQCMLAAQKGNHILGCIKKSVASRLMEGILPLCSGEIPSGVLRPALEPSAQERHGPVRVGPEEGHKNNQNDGAPLLKGKAERVGVVQPGEEKAPGRHCSTLPVPEDGLQESWRRTFDKGME